jgi:hypothetical protein
MGRAGREAALDRFTKDCFVERFEKLYRGLK